MGWSNLGTVADEKDDFPAQMALGLALQAIPPRGLLGAEELAKAYAGTRKAADAQTAPHGCAMATRRVGGFRRRSIGITRQRGNPDHDVAVPRAPTTTRATR